MLAVRDVHTERVSDVEPATVSYYRGWKVLDRPSGVVATLSSPDHGYISLRADDVATVKAKIDNHETTLKTTTGRRAKDDLAPVGAEDPERAAALAKHEAGLTKSQDKRTKDMKKRTGDAVQKWRVLLDNMDEGSVETLKKGTEHEAYMLARKKYPGFGKVVMVRKSEKAKDAETNGLSESEVTELAKLKAKRYVAFKSLTEKEKARYEVLNSKRANDAEILPIPIKTSNAVPMPTENDGAQRYATDRWRGKDKMPPMRAKDIQAGSKGDKLYQRMHAAFTKYGDSPELKKAEKALKTNSYEAANIMLNRIETAKATGSAQISGSAPADHMQRAALYEVQGDRARALDSYRAAASGYRRASDKANEAKARDGIAACQTVFAQQYDHPGTGRTKVCDSADTALRTAIERTRAGERVIVDGRTVRPGTVRDSFNGLVSKLERSGKSKGYATKIAGKVAGEQKAKDREAQPVGDATEFITYAGYVETALCKNCKKKIYLGETVSLGPKNHWYHVDTHSDACGRKYPKMRATP